MKSILLFSCLLLFMCNLNAQYIPNGGFESWSSTDPNGWSTLNSFVTGSVTKETTDVNSGANSAKVETKTFIIYPVCGTLTNATITPLTSAPYASITGGVSFSQRPESFTGFYKYTPGSGTDYCTMVAYLFKHNNTSGVLDTVAVAQMSNSNAVNSWISFNAVFTYLLPDYPDTLQVELFSSNPFAASTGSVLKIDDLNLTGGTLGVAKYSLFKGFNVYPNPCTDILNVQFARETQNSVQVAIYSLVGKKMKEFTLPVGTQLSTINIHDLKSGMYFVQVNSGKDKFTQRITVR